MYHVCSVATHCSCMRVHNVGNPEVHSPDSPVKVGAKPCKRKRKLMQTSPEQNESCALDCMLSPDTLVKAFVQIIANTCMNEQFTETEKQVHQKSWTGQGWAWSNARELLEVETPKKASMMMHWSKESNFANVKTSNCTAQSAQKLQTVTGGRHRRCRPTHNLSMVQAKQAELLAGWRAFVPGQTSHRGVCNNRVTRQWKTKYEIYEESTQDRRKSASLIEKNTKPDTPAGSASCEHHVLVGAIIVERLIVLLWVRYWIAGVGGRGWARRTKLGGKDVGDGNEFSVKIYKLSVRHSPLLSSWFVCAPTC